MNALAPLPPAARNADPAGLAQCIAALLGEREEAAKSVRAAGRRFDAVPLPPPLTLRFSGPFGALSIEVEPDYLREQLPRYSPSSSRGRRLRRLLGNYDKHRARLWAARETSGFAAAWEAAKRVHDGMRQVTALVLAQEPHSNADVALRAAALLACELTDRPGGYLAEHAPDVISGLLDFAATKENAQ